MKIQKHWINEILMKRKAQVSTVIIVETNDPKRVKELFEFLRESKVENIGDHKLIHYDVWEGLRNLRTNAPIDEKGDAIMQALGGGSGITPLPQALRKADDMLKTEKTIFIMTGIIEQIPALTLAVNNWCHHQDIFKTTNKSMVIIVISDASIFPQETLEKIPIITPPISLQNERQKLLVRIADSLSKKHNLKIEVKSELITTTSGLNLHETETVVLESIFRHKAILPEAVTSLKKEIVEKSGILEIYQPEYGFDAIGGYQSIKAFVYDSIIKILKMPERAKQFSVSMPRGALFYGPPGTGKTLFGKAIANETKLPFILLKTENIFSSLVGSSERKMKSALKIIEECAPAIVFMDEIDRMGTRSDISTDSVTGDTPVLIKSKGEIECISIKTCIDRYEKGEEIEILSIDKEFHGAFKKIRGAHSARRNDIYTIKCTGGKIRTTGDHSVFVFDNNSGYIVSKPTRELKVGDYLVSFYGNPSILEPQEIRVSDITTTITDRLGRKYRKIISNANLATKEFMRIAGYYLSEGCVSTTISFGFGSHHMDKIRELKKLMKEVFGIKPTWEGFKKHITAYEVEYNNAMLKEIFTKLFGKGAHTKKIPGFFYTLSTDLILELLDAYKEDSHTRKYGEIDYKSVSKELITELAWLMRLNKLPCRIYEENNPDHLSPQGTLIKGGMVYMLCVNNKGSLLDRIPTIMLRRIRKEACPVWKGNDSDFLRKDAMNRLRMKEILTKTEEYISLMLEIIKLHKEGKSWLEIERITQKISRGGAKHRYKRHKEKSSKQKLETSLAMIKYLRKLLDSDLGISQIKKIGLHEDEQRVYDVSVTDSKAFFGGNIPILLHNSGTSRRIFSQMLEYLGDESRKALMIGTTNTIEHLDEAFIRTGRFDRLIPVSYPDEKARKEIFNVHINVKRRVPVVSLNLEELVKETKTYTGAEIEELVKRATLIAFNDEGVSKVTQDHFKGAMKGFKIDTSQRLKQMRKFLAQAEKYCNDQNFLEKLKKEEKIDRIDALELE